MKATYHKKTIRREEFPLLVGWRFGFLCFGMLAALFWLASHVAFLQVISPEQLVKEGDKRSLRIQEVAPTRGMITDRSGRPLAVSIPVSAVWIDPKVLNEKGGVENSAKWQALASTLGITLQDIQQKATRNPTGRFVYLARQVSSDVAKYINELRLPGVYLREESKRYYPSAEVTAQLIGFTNIDDEGIEGIERSFERWLQGTPGERTVRKDRYGRVIEDIAYIESQSGQNLTLSIDERLQNILHREISKAVTENLAQSGTAVLVDVTTGEILAMANAPTYNPNNREGISADLMRNRAITDVFEPGSTVKPLVVMAGLDQKVIKENTVINTMPYRVNGFEIKDVAKRPELSITGILQKSSNIGVSHIALSMEPNVLVDTYKKFGLGQPTDIGLIGEQKGLYPNRARWSDIDRATFSFGYGLMVTPLQLARVYATIGSYGVYRPLSITRVDAPVAGERVFPEQTVRTVLNMMETVTHPGGGGVKAAVKDYRVAVKTGTAKKVGPDGKYIDKYIAYTAGVAPVSNPRYSLVVVINEPSAGEYYGGAVSAPVFGSIMASVLRTTNVQPDGIELTPEANSFVNN